MSSPTPSSPAPVPSPRQPAGAALAGPGRRGRRGRAAGQRRAVERQRQPGPARPDRRPTAGRGRRCQGGRLLRHGGGEGLARACRNCPTGGRRGLLGHRPARPADRLAHRPGLVRRRDQAADRAARITLGEQDVFRNGRELWQWNSDTRTRQPHHAARPMPLAADPQQLPAITPSQAAQQALALIDPSTKVTYRPGRGGGRPGRLRAGADPEGRPVAGRFGAHLGGRQDPWCRSACRSTRAARSTPRSTSPSPGSATRSRATTTSAGRRRPA